MLKIKSLSPPHQFASDALRRPTPLVFMALLALAVLLAPATANALTWPTSWTSIGACSEDEPAGDANPGAVDLVGGVGLGSAYVQIDDNYLYLRERVADSPTGSGGFAQDSWVALLQTAGDPSTYQWIAAFDGKAEQVQLFHNDPTTAAPLSFSPVFHDAAESLVWSDSSASFSRIVPAGSSIGGRANYFVDWAIPRAVLAANGIDPATSFYWFATSTNSNNFNKDTAPCRFAAAVAPTATPTGPAAPTATPTDPAVRTATETSGALPTSTPTFTFTPTPTATANTSSPTPTVTSVPTTEPTASGQDVVLSIAKVSEPNPATIGDVVTYTIDYSNIGTVSAPAPVLVETYDPNTTFISAVPPPDAGTNNRWTVGDLAPGDTGQIIVQMLVNEGVTAGTTLTNRVAINDGGANAETTETTGTAAATPGVARCPFVRVSDTDLFSGNHNPGTLVKVRVRYSDTCGGTGQLSLVDTLPAGLSFVSAANGGVFADGAVHWTVKPRAGVVSFTAAINADIAPGTILRNSVTLSDAMGNTASAAELLRIQRSHRKGLNSNLTITGRAPVTAPAGKALKLSFGYKDLRLGGHLSVLLPSNVMLIAAKPTPSGVGSDGVVVWEGAALRLPSGAVSLQVQVAPGTPPGTVLTHTAVVTDLLGAARTVSVDTGLR